MFRLAASIISLAFAIPALGDALKADAVDNFVDGLAIPEPRREGRAALDAVAKAQIPIARGDALDLYAFRSALFTVERGAPFYDKLWGKYAPAPKPGEICFDFQGRAGNFCGSVSLERGLFKVTVGGQSMSGAPVYGADAEPGQKRKFDSGVADRLFVQTECRMFREIAATAKLGSFVSIMEKTVPDGDEWSEDGEPFFNAELDARPTNRPCLVNEGQSLLFCVVAEQHGKTVAEADALHQVYVRRVSSCLGVAPSGPSRVRNDGFREGVEFEIGPQLQAYVMKGRRSRISADRWEQLFLVTFNIGVPPTKAN